MPMLIEVLKKQNVEDILVVVVGMIDPVTGYPFLEQSGVAAIFGAGANILEAARHVLELIRTRRIDRAAE
ncbi:MAG: hypothetical protein ACREHE_09485 [Rhizomicrobium sp.]